LVRLLTAPALAHLDRVRLGEALELAAQAVGLSEPNPRVGCVIGTANGRVLGRGHTQRAGQGHAEVMALRDAQAAGMDVKGATAWVTLEPCAHHGRTPPCSLALVEAGIARCVVIHTDPNPLVAGGGIAHLRQAGVQVDLLPADDPLAAAARDLNIGFFSRFERGRPWVRAKVACSADGRVALDDGRSKWITGEAARADGHLWRRRASAVMTGIGTVLADNPRLDVRAVPTALQPLRVVLDSALRTPANASILAPPGETLLIAAAGQAARPLPGAEIWDDIAPAGANPDLGAVLQALASRRGINEVHLEAGPTLTGAMAASDLIDEWLIYMAPMLLGPGKPAAHLPPLARLEDARRYTWLDATPVGSDLRLRMRRAGLVDPLYTPLAAAP
jgi:diaminohydroxyphosphoribosylaminopyrimidine deaminase/5-amino-6-(5-phosphoribosylamino)uracil reductase